MKKYALIPIVVAMLLSSCAVAPLLVSTGITNGLQYGVKDKAQRAAIACQIKNVSAQLQVATVVPDVAGFHALLDQYLPNNETKEVTESNLVQAYTLYLPTIQKKAPTAQLAEFKKYLDAANAGATPFCL